MISFYNDFYAHAWVEQWWHESFTGCAYGEHIQLYNILMNSLQDLVVISWDPHLFKMFPVVSDINVNNIDTRKDFLPIFSTHVNNQECIPNNTYQTYQMLHVLQLLVFNEFGLSRPWNYPEFSESIACYDILCFTETKYCFVSLSKMKTWSWYWKTIIVICLIKIILF